MPPWEMLGGLFVQAVLPAAGVAALVFALVRGVLGKLALPAAVALGFLAGVAEVNALSPKLPWWPRSAPWTWTLLATTLAVLVEAGVGVFSWAWGIRLLASGLVGWLLVPWGWGVALFALAAFVCWQLLETVLCDLPAGLGPFILAVLLGGGAACVLIHAHTASLTEAAVALSGALLGLAVVTLLSADPARGCAGPTVILLQGLLQAGCTQTFSEVPAASFFLVGLAPLPAGLALLWTCRWRRGVYLGVLLLVPVAIAVALAMAYETVEF